jgi:hypothetical protein
MPQNEGLTDTDDKCLSAMAFTEDMERYASSLRTLPTFGCVLHEAQAAPVQGET